MRRAFLFWFLAASSAFALEPPPPYFEDAAQDSQGVVWAYSRAEYNQVYSFDGSQWTVRPAPLGRNPEATPAPELHLLVPPLAPLSQNPQAMPAKVVRMTDGAVACVWRYGDHTVAVTRHLGSESRLLGTCPGEISQSGLTVTPLADSQNRIWITGDFPKIYRADGKGGVTLVHEITPDEFRNPGNAREGYNKIHAVEDGHGRVWVWSDPEADNWASLRGVLIFTGDKAELRDPCSSLKGARILTIARADDRHMWIAVANDGIYKIDLDTFDLQRMPDPSPKALCCVHEIFVNGGDVYAVEYLPQVQDALWRLRDGRWTQLIPHLDVHSNSWLPRFWLPIKEGLLVGSFGNGPWFIPKHGTPALFSWRSGFPFEDMHAFCRLADGTFFGISRGDQLFHGKLSLPPHELKNSRIVEIEPDRGWVYASTGHVWMVPRNPPAVLKEWDGLKWITHELPAGLTQVSELNEDDQGRLWLTLQVPNIFDPRTGQWQNFPSLEAALIAFKDKPVRFLHDEWFLAAQYSADHARIAYRRGVIEVNYFDGTKWQKWTRKQITGDNRDNAVGPPWFDENGKLHVNLRNKMSWQLDDAGKWSQIAWVSHFPDDIWSENANARDRHPVPPDGCVTNHPDSIVVDNLGTTWLTWQGELYKAIPGFCVKVFGADEINPFRTKRMLRDAFIDSQGNAFLLTASSEMGRSMIRPKGSAPATHIEMKRTGEDSYAARLDAHTKQKVTFRWQLDDGAWQLNKTDSLTFEHLPNGPHVLKVTAIDDQLNMDATPATAKFETKIDPNRQMALLVAQLFDRDYAKREIAVEALSQQPATALPALLKVRETATDDQRWWIDAAIQECERRAKASPGK